MNRFATVPLLSALFLAACALEEPPDDPLPTGEAASALRSREEGRAMCVTDTAVTVVTFPSTAHCHEWVLRYQEGLRPDCDDDFWTDLDISRACRDRGRATCGAISSIVWNSCWFGAVQLEHDCLDPCDQSGQ